MKRGESDRQRTDKRTALRKLDIQKRSPCVQSRLVTPFTAPPPPPRREPRQKEEESKLGILREGPGVLGALEACVAARLEPRKTKRTPHSKERLWRGGTLAVRALQRMNKA